MKLNTSSLICCILLVSGSIWGQSSFELVYDIFQNKCVDCHNADDLRGGLDLEGRGSTFENRMQDVYAQIVNGNPKNEYASGKNYKIIYPGRADKSFLFRKINGDFEPSFELHTLAGDPMPLRDGVVLSNIEKETIRQWILFGASETDQSFDESVIETYYNDGGQEAFPDGPPPAPAPGEGFQIKIGPFFLEPIGEHEYFWKYETDLTEDTEVNRLDFDISVYSHHLIIYNFENDSEQSIPSGLRNDQNHEEIGIVAGVQQSEDLILPENTAFKWDRNYVLDINSHVINYTTDPLKAEAYINVYTQADGQAAQQMFTIPIPNTEIYIPNDGEEVIAEQEIKIPFAGKMFVWGMLGHTHKYGTSYKTWTLDAFGQKDQLIYDASCPDGIPGCASPFYDYQHLPTRLFDPLFFIDAQKGIVHEAKWINNGPVDVTWGPTSDDEMMILGVFFTLDTTGLNTTVPAFKHLGPLQIFPNPFNEHINFRFPNYANGTLWIYDSLGSQLDVLKPNGKDLKWESDDLAPGLYYYLYQTSQGQQYTGKIIRS